MHKTQAINRLLVDTMSLYFGLILFVFGVASLNKMFLEMTTFSTQSGGESVRVTESCPSSASRSVGPAC